MNMKYQLLIIALLAGFALSCEREMSPEQADQFIKFYGSYLMDEAGDMEALDDGGFAICGVASLPDIGKRMVLVVTDEYGNLRSGFPKYYPDPDTGMVAEAAANTVVPIRGGQGGYLLAGYIERPLDGSLNTQKDIYLVKVSNAGTFNWQKIYGSVNDEEILHATERISSGFMLAGYKILEEGSDILIMGVEQEGDSITKLREHPFAKNSSANYILQAGNGYMCVCTYDKLGGKPGTDILTLSLNDNFDSAPKFLTGDSNEEASCVIEDGEGSFLALGNRLTASRSEMVIYQVEIDDDLQPVSSIQLAIISESNTDLIGKRLVKTLDGRYAIVGTRQSGNAREIMLQFLTSEYDPAERVLYGASGDQDGADIDVAGDGGIVMLGTTSYGENSMISLIKTNDTGDL